jgi:ribosomal-protein-alanine N-acetyltransferase
MIIDIRTWLRRWDRRQSPKAVAVPTEAVVREMSYGDLQDCWRLDQEVFTEGEAYDRETLRYLLSHNKSACFKVVTPENEMAGFVIGMIEPDVSGHIVALGVSHRHRRQGYAERLMKAVESRFIRNSIRTVRLEVRTSNESAQSLYIKLGYKILRRMPHYYTSGDDGYMMVKNF